VLLLTCGLGLFATTRMAGMHSATQVVSDNYLPSVAAVDELLRHHSTITASS